MKQLLLIIVCFSLFFGCATTKELTVRNVKSKNLQTTYSRPEVPKLPYISYQVVVKEDVVFYSLQERDYLNLSKFFTEIKGYIEELNLIINTYEEDRKR